MKNKKILIIAYVFPPIAYAGTYRTVRLCKHLINYNYNVTVLTIKEQCDLYNDYQLLNEIPNSINIIRTSIFDPFRFYRQYKNKFLGKPFGKTINWIVTKIIYIFTIPDHMIGWVPFAFTKAYRLIQKEKYDFIYVSSPPHSQQIICWMLKKVTRIKWIVDFRDPIINNIGISQIHNLQYLILNRLEKCVFKNADAIISNTKEAQKIFQKKYSRANLDYIYNSFDEDDFMGLSEVKFKKFTISHIGSIYGHRKIDQLLTAIQSLDKEGKICSQNFQLLLVGINYQGLTEQIQNYHLEEYIKISNAVRHKQALNLMVKSHLLLLVKGFGENSGYQIPGKLFEYLGSGNPVLCIAPRNSEAAQIVLESKAGFVVEEDPLSIRNILVKEYNKYLHAGIYSKLDRDLKYESKKMVSKFCKLFNNVLETTN